MATISSLINFLSPLFRSTTTSQLPHNPHNSPKSPHQNTLSSSPNPSLTITTPQTQQNVPIVGKKEEYPSDIIHIISPSLAYSNTLFFSSSSYNVQILVDDNEPDEKLLGRFKREVIRAGVMQECRRRRYHENAQEKKKRKSREAAKRLSRMRRGFRPREPFQNQDEATVVQKNDDDDDNWEMPEGDSPREADFSYPEV